MRLISWKELVNLPNGTYVREEERRCPYFGLALEKIDYDILNQTVIFRNIEDNSLVTSTATEAYAFFDYYLMWEEDEAQ